MREQDFKEFGALLDSVCSLLSRGAYMPNASNTALFFRALAAYDIGTVRGAFDAHVKDPVRGKFPPSPGDVIAQIADQFAQHDGRPGVEEAWALLPAGEDATVVWTEEMSEAHAICSPLLASGDRVAARMAFKEAYTRLIAASRQAGKGTRWVASLGSDLEARKRALAAAVEAGRLVAEGAFGMCPALPPPASLLLAAPPKNERAAAKAKRELAELADAKRSGEPSDPLAWARDLRDREKGGESLTESQRAAWRKALDCAPAGGHVLAGFTPIPRELLPPGMRNGGAP